MNKIKILILLLSLPLLTSCGNDDGPDGSSDIVGVWHGERNYYNPAGGNKTQYLTISFYANKTGELDYEAPSSVSKAYFTYSVSGNKVICKGAYASSYDDGTFNSNFSLTLTISGGRLIPDGQFNAFVLEREGGSGPSDNHDSQNPDYSKKLIKTWVGTDGKRILNIKSDGIETYLINSRNEYTYYDLFDYSDYYDRTKQTLNFEATSWFIKECTDNTLVLNANGYTYSYTSGSSNDIPKAPDLQSYLPLVMRIESADSKYTLFFEKNNQITYYEKSGIFVNTKYLGKQEAELIAMGSWEKSVIDKEMICYFTSVSWLGAELPENANIFPGWKPDKTCIKYIKIDALTPTKFKVTLPNGNTYLMH